MQPSAWPVRPWQDVAKDAVESAAASHLSVLDSEGYPLPMRVYSFERVDEGFRLAMPKGVPWKLQGKASLTFAGLRKARARLEYESRRRGQSLPVIPVDPPPRTRIAMIRQARIESASPITGLSKEHGNRTT
jgi:hypothetical protein